MSKLTFKQVKADLKAVGVSCYKTGIDDEIRIAPRVVGSMDDEAKAYYTTSLQDALDTGRMMSASWRNANL